MKYSKIGSTVVTIEMTSPSAGRTDAAFKLEGWASDSKQCDEQNYIRAFMKYFQDALNAGANGFRIDARHLKADQAIVEFLYRAAQYLRDAGCEVTLQAPPSEPGADPAQQPKDARNETGFLPAIRNAEGILVATAGFIGLLIFCGGYLYQSAEEAKVHLLPAPTRSQDSTGSNTEGLVQLIQKSPDVDKAHADYSPEHRRLNVGVTWKKQAVNDHASTLRMIREVAPAFVPDAEQVDIHVDSAESDQ